ncbi:unnamed protein product, partial [Porites lobata]
ENARGNAKYTSPEIQNELLDLSAQQIVNNIVSDCKKAGCYAFIADESTDVSVKEQISVCVRFVQKGNNGRHIIPHVLNLCIVHSSKLPLIRNIMDTMQEVSQAFKFSAKRFLVFQEQLRQNADVREEMGRQSKLKVLCETRWASRADCLNVFVTSFQVGYLSLRL